MTNFNYARFKGNKTEINFQPTQTTAIPRHVSQLLNFSSTSDCIIFLFLGIALVEGPQYWHTGFTVWTITFTLICRFLGTYGLTFLANRRRIRKINLQEMFIMAYGGLRGAVGFSLVEMIKADVVPPAQMFVTTTLAVVMFTIFIQVKIMKSFINTSSSFLLWLCREERSSSWWICWTLTRRRTSEKPSAKKSTRECFNTSWPESKLFPGRAEANTSE